MISAKPMWRFTVRCLTCGDMWVQGDVPDHRDGIPVGCHEHQLVLQAEPLRCPRLRRIVCLLVVIPLHRLLDRFEGWLSDRWLRQHPEAHPALAMALLINGFDFVLPAALARPCNRARDLVFWMQGRVAPVVMGRPGDGRVYFWDVPDEVPEELR